MHTKGHHENATNVNKLTNTLTSAVQYALVLSVVLVATFVIFRVHPSLINLNISILYLFIVLLCATFADSGVTLFCGLFCFLCYDFFLVPPVFTFQVASPLELINLFFFLMITVIVCVMAGRSRHKAIQAAVYRDADSLRTTMLDLISHNLRTPLAVIKTALTSLLVLDNVSLESRRLLQDANEECDRLTRLVANILRVSRLEAHSLALHTDWNSVDEVISMAFNHWPEAVNDKRLSAEIPDDLPLFQFDFDLIEAVLVNLIDNAFRHGKPPVKLVIQRNSKDIQIAVVDSGNGVPIAMRSQLFSRFATTKQTGIGLGLAVCRGLVEAHGGRLWAEFDPTETRFIFSLPFTRALLEGELDASSAYR